MSSRDTKIKRTLLQSGLGLLAKEYEKNPSYGRTRVHDNMVPWALGALGTKITIINYLLFITYYFKLFKIFIILNYLLFIIY